eukprot:g22008.t1
MTLFRKTRWMSLAVALTAAGLSAGTAATALARSPVVAEKPVKAAAAPRIQIAILLDTSNSMDGLIHQARQQLWRIVNEFATARRNGKAPNLEVALMQYGNNSLPAKEGYIQLVVPFTDDLDKVSEALFALRTNGGNEYCGQVIDVATRSLAWSNSKQDLKCIYIAGNEPFTQGPVNFRKACQAAVSKSINVNTIFCGPEKTGIATKWQEGAVLADGSFLSINQNRVVAAIPAPQDKKLAELGKKINKTYIPYGEMKKRQALAANQSVQDANAAQLGGYSAVTRAVTKGSRLYRNSSWDLVDALKDGKIKLEAIKVEFLPKAMQKMTLAERKAYVAKNAKERADICKQIKTLNEARNKYACFMRSPLPVQVWLDKVHVDIVDQVAVKTYDCRFRNPNGRAIVGGTCYMELEPGAQIDNLSVVLNGKTVQAEILGVEKANKVFTEIVKNGGSPALLEFYGSQLIQTKVPRIGPQKEIIVKLRYTTVLKSRNGLVRLQMLNTNPKALMQPLKRAAVTVRIRSKQPIKNVYSPTHEIKFAEDKNWDVVVNWSQQNYLPKHPFVMYYQTNENDVGASLLAHRELDEEGHFMLMLSPTIGSGSGKITDDNILPKDIVFCIDTSGSMIEGGKMEQAKTALKYCINHLRKGDRFNIVDFGTGVRTFSQSGLIETSDTSRSKAIAYVDKLAARGGTAIQDALVESLQQLAKGERLKMIVFATDGLPTIGERDPQAILKTVSKSNAHDVRIFSFGEGVNVNSRLLDFLALNNRGESEYVLPKQDIAKKISGFFDRVGSPILTDLKVTVDGVLLKDVFPRTVADIYRGEQVVLYGRYSGHGKKTVRVTGMAGDRQRVFEYELDFPEVSKDDRNAFVPRLWAGQKVDFLLNEIRKSEKEDLELVKEVTYLAKLYGIVTPYTSFLMADDVVNQTAAAQVGGFIRRMRGQAGGLRGKAAGYSAVSNAWHQSNNRKNLSRNGIGAKYYEQAQQALRQEGKSQNAMAAIRYVGNRAFYNSGKIWYDSRYDVSQKSKLRNVQENAQLTAAFLKRLTVELNKAKLVEDHIGVQMLSSGAIEGFIDENKDGKKLGPNEKKLFLVEIDHAKSRLIATDDTGQSGETYRRDRRYHYRPGGFFMGYMLGSMMGRQNSFYSGGRTRPNYSSMKMNNRGYHTNAVAKARTRAKASGRSYNGRSTGRSSTRGARVYQFSITIGLFMFAMGLGSYVTKRFEQDLVSRFVLIEIAVALVGGICSTLLFAVFPYYAFYKPVMYTLIIVIGALVGMEIPILTRILSRVDSLRDSIAHVLSLDYLGALIGSVAFPLLLLPHLGLFRSSYAIGLLNVAVVFFTLFVFRSALRRMKACAIGAAIASSVLIAGIVYSTQIRGMAEQRLFGNSVIFYKQTPYQRIILTKSDRSGRLQLYIDGHLQFAEVDEHRYHESLVHPVMSMPGNRKNILILGGGDGIAAREVFKYPEVERVDLVDIDPEITRLCNTHAAIRRINQDALRNPKLHLHHTDADTYIRDTEVRYDRVIIDLPDPHNEVLSKLYSVTFYRKIRKCMSPNGYFVTQSSSPFATREAYWCIGRTIAAAGMQPLSYQAMVPTFGQWGFHLAGANGESPPKQVPIQVETRYLTTEVLRESQVFGRDTAPPDDTTINTVFQPSLYQLYQRGEWR